MFFGILFIKAVRKNVMVNELLVSFMVKPLRRFQTIFVNDFFILLRQIQFLDQNFCHEFPGGAIESRFVLMRA